MLVFRRKVGEAVVLDGRIEVQVLDITGNRVKLGFIAPAEVLVTRKEIVLTREENRRAAAFSSASGLSRLATTLRVRAPGEAPPPDSPAP
jgi:carbon storage regulator CsrA